MNKEERIKSIMSDAGMPDSLSLYTNLYQFANELEQHVRRGLADYVEQKREEGREITGSSLLWASLSD